MMTLAVHTSSPTLGLAVVQDGTLVGEAVVLAQHEHLEHTAPAIRDLISALGIDVRSLDGFGVALGPGSFSGVRVGLATVKGMALALNKPVIGMCSLELDAYDVLLSNETGIVLMDAKRGQVFAASYRRTSEDVITVEPPALVFPERIPENTSGPQTPVLVWADKSIIPPDTIRRMSYRTPTTPSAVTCALIAEKRLKRGLCDNLHALKPIYVRRPDAEERSRAPFTGNS